METFDWVTISELSGNAGEKSITITCSQENTTLIKRVKEFVALSPDEKSKASLFVTQDPSPLKVEIFDYIVKDNETLRGMEKSGATSILIKKGNYNTSPGYWNTPVSCRRIVGEAGNQISGEIINNVSLNSDIEIIGVHCYSIKGFSRVTSCSVTKTFSQCNNLLNCTANSLETTGASYNNCTNLINCVTNYNYANQNQYYSFMDCENLLNCTVNTTNIFHRGIYRCNNLTNCVVNTVGISSCFGVFRCKSKNYSSSYYSNDSTSNYACANTLNGGWNELITG